MTAEPHRQLALKIGPGSAGAAQEPGQLSAAEETLARIAVIGPNADSLDALEGNYNGTPSKPVTVLAGIRKRFAQSQVAYVQGIGLIGEVTKPVPASALYTDGSRKRHGFSAEYFANTTLEGKPVLERVDPAVNFSWGFAGVNAKLAQNYSARWSGVLVAPATADYLLGFTGQDGYRLWVDGDLVAEDWTAHRPATTQTKPMHLEKDRAYKIKIEYFQTIRGAEARLVWGRPGEDEQKALAAARNSDLVIVVLGLSARIEGEEMNVRADGFAGGDRTSIDLPAPQERLLEHVYAAGKPTLLILMNGSALGVNWAEDKLPAILEAWYPGEEGGTAVAAALAGDFSPGGRLPVTFYKSVSELPPFDDYSMAKRTYRYFDGEALYPFGYGLSYASFAYANPRVDKANVNADGTVNVSVDVTNSGPAAGDEVVQLYLTHAGVDGAPLRALKGFRRIHLERGQRQTVSFALRERELSTVDGAGAHRIMPGKVQVWLGGGQSVVRSGLPKTAGVATEFSITSEATLPD